MPDFGDGLVEADGDGESDLCTAARRATAAALAPLGARRPDLFAVFVTHRDPDVVAAAGRAAMEAAGARLTLGCGAGGVIGSRRGVEARPAVATWAAALPGARLTPFTLEALRGDNGFSVAGMPTPADDDAVAVVLADPYTFPVQGFVEQSPTVLGTLPLVGGLTAGITGPGSARLFLDGRVHERGVVGALIGGDVRVRTLVSQGCRPIGPPMTVTRAEGPNLLELAGTPAYPKLEQILRDLGEDDRALAARGLHLGIAMDEYAHEHRRGDFLVRGVVGADPEAGTLTVGDVVDVGRTVQFQVRDAAGAGEDLDVLMSTFRDQGTPGGALLFSCNGRGAGMFGTADHDPSLVTNGLSPDGLAGFFAAGEIGPVAARNHLHGFTASLLAFG